MTSLTYDDLKLPYFLNSRTVGSVGGITVTVSDAIKAALIAKNNVFVAGKKGTGKTQLLFDVCDGLFGGKGVMLEGRTDLKAREVYEKIEIPNIAEGGFSSEDVVKLAQNVKYRFLGADELNRCPEPTQNELLSVMNGYILHKGVPVQLGDGFCVGLATGNLGDGEYVGTFRIDAALADRLHLFLNFDYWKPTDDDMAEIDSRKKIDPRVKLAEPKDLSDKIVEAHKQIAGQETPFEMTVAGRYIERALDYCKKFETAGNSKDALDDSWPGICTHKNCDLRNTLCGRVKSVGERTVQAAKKLAQGLQYVARLKNPEAKDDPLGAMMLAVRLMLPYSGVISKAYLREEGIFNNPNIAAKNLAEAIEKEISNELYAGDGKPGALAVAMAYAVKGRLDERPYTPSKPEWKFVQPHLKQINEEAKTK